MKTDVFYMTTAFLIVAIAMLYLNRNEERIWPYEIATFICTVCWLGAIVATFFIPA